MTVAVIAGGALYIRLRWWRSPQAYRAMIVVAVCYLVAGAVLGRLLVHLIAPAPSSHVEAVPRGGGTSVGR